MIVTKEFSVGRLYWSSFRDIVNKLNFTGSNIQYIESSGYIFKTFTVKAAQEDIDKLVLETKNLL